MTDKKLTDEEIIKNLKFCEDCSANINIDIIDLINRQKLELENLKVENQSLRSAANSLKMHYEEARAEIERLKQRNAVCEAANRCIVWQRDRRDREIEELHSQIAGLNIYKSKIKAEAYKEFAERLKEKSEIVHLFSVHTGDHYMVEIDDIDNLVKEMVGENNG